MLTGLFKDARCSRFSNLHTCILLVVVCPLDNAWVGDSYSFIFFFLARVIARLEMRPTRGFGVGILNYAN